MSVTFLTNEDKQELQEQMKDIQNGDGGQDGASAYEIALAHGFEGSEEEWLASLQGKDGYTPIKGTDYFTEADKQDMVNEVINALPTWEGGAY